MAKSNKIEMQRRENDVFKQYISGVKTPDIVQYCSEEWNISDRQAFNLIDRAFKRFKQAFEDSERKDYLFEAIERYDLVYVIAIEKKDLQAANTAIQNKCKLLGLEEISSIIFNLNLNEYNSLTNIELTEKANNTAEVLGQLNRAVMETFGTE